MDTQTSDRLQVQREIALHEIVAPYFSSGDGLNLRRSTDALFREIVHEWINPAVGGPPSEVRADPLTANFERFRARLAEQVRVAVGRGRPEDFPKLWQQLRLAPQTEAKRFEDEASLLYFLVLHQLLQSMLCALSVEDVDESAEATTSPADETRDSALAEATDAAADTSEDDSIGVGDESLQLSQQELYSRIWDAVAVELTLRGNEDGRDDSTSVAARWRRLREGSARERAIESLREALEQSCSLKREDGLKFAAMLTDLVRESAEPRWFRIEQTEVKSTAKLAPSPALQRAVRKLAETRRVIARNAPLIAPPLHWGPQGTRHGGFHWRTLPFVKFPWQNGPIRQFIAAIEDAPSIVPAFEAVNLLQDTSWRVNWRVWEVVRSLIELSGASVTGLSDGRLFPAARPTLGESDSDAAELLAKLRGYLKKEGKLHEAPGIEVLDAASRQEWRSWIAGHFLGPRRHGLRSGPAARLMTRVAISTLMDIAPRSRFWFVWNADTRGRVYPTAGAVSPQGDDLTRSLLEFAEGKALTVGGARALALHGSAQVERRQLLSNLGFDEAAELTLDRRVDWIEQHSAQIVASARDPLGQRWWRDVAKDPFRFLAFCFAWCDYREHGPQVLCHLPVHVDGTCNGLQHIAAIMRDAPLARATNVLPDVGPRDIYEEVAARVRARLGAPSGPSKRRSASRAGVVVDFSNEDYQAAVDFLQAHPEFVNREMAKAVVMIIPYGAGPERYQAAIAGGLVRRILPSWPSGEAEPPKTAARTWLENWGGLERWVPPEDVVTRRRPVNAAGRQRQAVARWLRQVCARHLAEHFGDVLKTEYPVIERFTRELRRAVDPVLKRGLPVMWVAPSGFPVLQRSFKFERREIDVKSLQGRLRFSLQRPLDEVSPMHQKRGILPNFVHSMDAAHLVATARLARTRGVTALSTVHDAFATHPADVPTLQQCIRDGFVEVYPMGVSHLSHFVAWCEQLARAGTANAASDQGLGLNNTERALLDLAARLAPTPLEAAKEPASPKRGSKRGPTPPHRTPSEDWIEKVRESAYFFS